MVKRLKTDSQGETTQEPHDAFFRQFLAQPAMAAEFIQNYLPADVVSLLDLTQLQPEKDTFVDARLRKHFSDLLYSAPLKSGGKVFVYLLFEHKSQPDKQARLQLLRYMVRIWEQQWRKKRQLSPIVPILFYHGQEKWSYSVEFADLIEPPEALKQYTPHFRHLLTDLSTYSDAQVAGGVWMRVSMLMLKHIFDADFGQHLPEILRLVSNLVQQESGLEMLRTILLYIAQANQSVTEAEFEQAVAAATLPEGENLMPTLVQQWEARGRAEGRVEGRVEGLEEGLDAQRQTLMRLLNWRFHLSASQQTEYSQRIGKVNDLQLLTQLIDHLLAAHTLADFDQRLAAALTPTSDS